MGLPKNQFCASWACYWTKWVQTWHAWTWRVNLEVQMGLKFEHEIDQKVNGIDQIVNDSFLGKISEIESIAKKAVCLLFSMGQSYGLNPTDWTEYSIECDWIESNRLNRTESNWIRFEFEIWNCQCLEATLTIGRFWTRTIVFWKASVTFESWLNFD